MAGGRQEAERRLTAEYMAGHYPGQSYYIQYALGPLPVGITDLGLARPWLRKVDGLVIKEKEIDLLEMKIWSAWDGIDKLPVYKAAIPHTPWLGYYKDFPVNMILVTPRVNPSVQATADMLGIKVEVVGGGWIDELVGKIDALYTAEGRAASAQKRKMRAWLGLE
jgi:hypothetical protein